MILNVQRTIIKQLQGVHILLTPMYIASLHIDETKSAKGLR